ncbi:MAG TPA: hypothetical protein VGI12_21550 [Vicinamibacterales bacterium]
MLQHAARQVAGDRLEDVIGDAHLGQFCDHRVPQIVETQSLQARGVAKRSPGRVPLQHRLRGVEASPLACRPEVVLGLRVVEHVGPLEHPGDRVERRRVQRDHAMARLVLAPSHVQQFLDQIDVAAPEMLHLDRTHRRVRRNDRGAVDVLPFLA